MKFDLDKLLELEANASPAPWDIDAKSCGFNEEDKILIDAMRNSIKQICEELKAAMEYFAKDSEVRQISLKDGLQAASNAWQDREDLLQKYHEVSFKRMER